MSPDQPASQEAVAAAELDPEPEAPSPPAPALRWLPGDPSPRGRSQSDLSSASSRGRPLRVHISGSGKGGAGWSGGGPGRASHGQVAVARVAIVPGRPRAAVGGGGLRARAKAAVPTSPPPAGLQKLGVPRLRGQATGGCVQVGAPLCCAGAARLGFRGFPWTPSPLCGARRHPPVLALVLGLIWFLDYLGLTGLRCDCGPSEGCGPLTSEARVSTGLGSSGNYSLLLLKQRFLSGLAGERTWNSNFPDCENP